MWRVLQSGSCFRDDESRSTEEKELSTQVTTKKWRSAVAIIIPPMEEEITNDHARE